MIDIFMITILIALVKLGNIATIEPGVGATSFAGVVIIIAGLHFLGVIHIPILHREARYHADTRPAGLFGAYIIGLAFAFGWTPCIGPVLGAILAVAAGEQLSPGFHAM